MTTSDIQVGLTVTHRWRTKQGLVRFGIIGLILLSLIPIGIVSEDAYRVSRLVNEAFPYLPSDFANAIEASMILAPTTFRVEELERQLLQAIRYPYINLPIGRPRLSTGNSVEDHIYLAQKQQGLASKAVAGGVFALDGIRELKPTSLEPLGQALYLSLKHPGLTGYLDKVSSPTPEPGSSASSPQVGAMRTIFEATYGSEALRQVLTKSAW